MARLKVLNPVARSMVSSVDLAPRVGDLNGKRIGLYWNHKAGGNVALRRTEALLGEQHPGARFAYYEGDVSQVRHATAALADRIARECDAVVGTTSD